MDFTLSSRQRELQAEVREFAEKELRPGAEERSRDSLWDKDLYRRVGEHRWPGVRIPESYGGMGRGAVEHAIIIEEVSRVDGSMGSAMNLVQQTIRAILEFGTEEQKDSYLPALARGERYTITGLTEATAGSKLSDMQTTAVRDGSEWVINGAKTEVHIPQHVQACIVYARTEAGISAFLVDTSNPGFEVLAFREISGLRGFPMYAVGFRDCRVPREALLGRDGKGIEVFFNSFDFTRIGNAAKCIGIAEGALDDAIEYARKRKIGDNVVTDFQGIRWQIVDLKTRLQGARLMMYEAACEYEAVGRSTRKSAMAKLLAATTAMEATTAAMQITGSYGCFSNRPFARYMMDAAVSRLTGGSIEILRNTIARYELGKATAPTP